MVDLDDNTLSAYVDGELDAASAREVERAMAHDPAARESARGLNQTAALIRAAYNAPVHEEPPQRLVDVVRGARPRAARRVALPLAAAIAGLAVGLGGGFVVADLDAGRDMQVAAADLLLDEIASYHVVYAREQEHLVEVPAERGPHLRAWLGARLNRRLEIPDLSANGLTFRGGRLLVVDGRPVAQLMYTAPGREPVAICIAPGDSGAAPPRLTRRRGLTLLSWRSDGYVYVIVGRATEAFERALMSAAAAELERT